MKKKNEFIEKLLSLIGNFKPMREIQFLQTFRKSWGRLGMVLHNAHSKFQIFKNRWIFCLIFKLFVSTALSI